MELYVVKSYEDGEVYEYEYGNLQHAEEHLAMEKVPAEIYLYQKGELTLIKTNRS